MSGDCRKMSGDPFFAPQKGANMHIKKVSVSELQTAAYNPRKDLQPGDPEYQKLKESINKFGCVEPIVWNERTGNVVGGHQRLKVLIDQGAEEVEVSVVDLDPIEEKALNVALNKISGSWDMDKLADIMQELVEADFASLTGYDEKEIADMLKEAETFEMELNEASSQRSEGGNFNYREQYGVIVICENESVQQEVYENLIAQGYECKVVAT